MSFAISNNPPNPQALYFMCTRVKKGKSKNTSGENKGLGNGCKCKHRIAKPTCSKSMNQISRNHKTGGLNSKYEIWAVPEGYFSSCFQCSRGSCVPSLGDRVLVGWSRGLHMLINPSSLCWSLRWLSCPPNPQRLPRCSALPKRGALLLLPHIPDELPGRTAKPQCPPCHSGEQQLLAPGLFSSLWIGGEEEVSLFSLQTLIRERHSFE